MINYNAQTWLLFECFKIRLFPYHIKYSPLYFRLTYCQQWFLKTPVPGHRACLFVQQLVRARKYVCYDFIYLNRMFGGVDEGLLKKGLVSPIRAPYFKTLHHCAFSVR